MLYELNDVQYSVTTNAGSETNVESGAVPSKQLTDDTSLIPFIGIQNDSSAGLARNLNVYYQKISRDLFE